MVKWLKYPEMKEVKEIPLPEPKGEIKMFGDLVLRELGKSKNKEIKKTDLNNKEVLLKNLIKKTICQPKREKH